MTLLELIVVLALMGLVLAIAAPSFIAPPTERKSELAGVVDVARRAAILRGEPVTLSVDAAGAWRIDGDATPTAPPIGTGTLGSRFGPFRVHISALGTCVGEATGATNGGATGLGEWNVVDCRLVRPGAAGSAR